MVTVTDLGGLPATVTVNVTIENVNDPPVPTATPNPILPVQDGPAVSFSVAAE